MSEATLNGKYAISLTVGELASKIQGTVEGDREAIVLGASSIDDAQAGDIVFAENARHLNQAIKSRASAIVAFLDAVTPDKPLIRVENPRFAFVKILELFRPRLDVMPGVHPAAVVGENVKMGEGVSIGANATIGDNVTLGDRTVVMPGSYVGEESSLGEECILYPNVTVSHGSVLGNRVIIHSGSVIGADGFGYAQVGDRSYKIPQIGNVEIRDDVEIGACCTIDRAKTGSTIIGERTKIDNLTHIAHNVKTGSDCIIVAQVGVAGSTTLGNRVILAGQAGVKDHIKIGDGVIAMGQSAVFSDVEPGQVISGYPARPHLQTQRSIVEAQRLPETVKRIKELEKSNARLQATVEILARKLGVDLLGGETPAGAGGPE
jgi:UDP-3-O-[3-hydroxymyristoyl] glucosamine N-acyltransferase